jgi:D-3-phosphoglycerate dehydrogenase
MERLRSEGFRILEWREGTGLGIYELKEKVSEAFAWIVGAHPVGSELLEKGLRLRVIAKHGVGVNNLDLHAATERGIVVVTAPGTNDQAVADLTIGLLLSLVRAIPKADASVKLGRWELFCGFGLAGKKMGIIGLGRIGQNVSRRAKGFDMEILAHDPYLPGEVARNLGVALADLDTLLTKSDIVSLHVPLMQETEGLIGRHEISMMKDGVWVVNTSRGKVVQEKAMYEALISGKVAGYATDVFEQEPPLGNPLLSLPNVVVTPHIGAYTKDALRMMGDRVVDSILRVFRGERPEFIINPEVYPLG